MALDLNRAYRLNPAVSLRPEPFGALAYHFGNRRLSFLKTRQLVTVVRLLASHDSAAAALAAAGVPAQQRAAYTAALATLADSEVIDVR
jgi:putative mycofactocin binding protein MftB